MPVCGQMPWGGSPHHGPFGGWGPRGGRRGCSYFRFDHRGNPGGFGFGGCRPAWGPSGRGCGGGRGGFGSWGTRGNHSSGGFGFWAGPHRGMGHRGGGRGFGGRCGGRRPCFGWGAAPGGPRRWHCRRDTFQTPFDDALLADIFVNFVFPFATRDDETGEMVPDANGAGANQAQTEENASEEGSILIDTRQFAPEDIRVRFTRGQLEVKAVRVSEEGTETTLRRSLPVPVGAKVSARLRADGHLCITVDQTDSQEAEAAEDAGTDTV